MSTIITPMTDVGGFETENALTLDRDMILEDEFSWCPIASEVKETLGGVIKQSRVVSEKGRSITLASKNGFGRQKKETVEALQAQCSIIGKKFTLLIQSGDRSLEKLVSYSHEKNPSPVQFAASFDQDGIPTGWYDGTISLMVETEV